MKTQPKRTYSSAKWRTLKVNLLGKKDLLTKRRYFEAAARSNMELETQQIIAFVRIAFHQKKQIVAKSNMYECQLRLCACSNV